MKNKRWKFSFKRFMEGLGAVLVLLALFYCIGMATIKAIPNSPVLSKYVVEEVEK